MTDTTSPSVGAATIADALGLPPPTPQQRAVIEAPLAPALVVAGAGSGKTETMAGRVLWLLANRLVRPSEILGLTFTRKAAGELGERIGRRIGQLAHAGLVEPIDPFETPTVSTYNAYANALYRDNAAILGRESDGTVLGEAAAWQLARSVVLRSTDARLAALGKNLDAVTRAVLMVARGLAENVADPEAVRAFAQDVARVADLPPGGRGEYGGVLELAATVGALDVLVDLAAEFEAAKARRGFVEYSDQVALALSIVERAPRVVETERERARVVLLDEYQDTSVVQTRLLAAVFAGHAVMAVGDPNQSIYGWRGASAANLEEFPAAFGGATRFSLTTSWRNGTRILDAANALVAPFARDGVPVDPLEPGPTASSHRVETLFVETVVDEADAVAERLARALDVPTPPSAALLFRTRSAQPFFLDALRRRGVPFHVLGLGGLLAEPEIADLVSALSVVHDPSAGLELVRLLAGGRWRIGVADLHALRRLASWLRERDYAGRRYDDEVAAALRSSVASGEGGSLVDALDMIGTAPDGHRALEGFTVEGLERLRDAARTFTRLRARGGLELPEFVAVVLHELRLDIEVAANDARPLGSATIDAFFDAVSDYLALDDVATLGGFLSWLREAERREDLSPRPEDPEPGTVQVLTIHGSKGLEWDLVVVPRLVEDELPGRPAEGGYRGWLGFGQLPWPFRGDAGQLPHFAWRDATTRVAVRDAEQEFTAAVREHLLAEERRLAYVAVTRARHGLLLTGSFWSTGARPRVPSRYLLELAEASIVSAPPAAPASESNPLGDSLERLTWPRDPLGGRRAAVEAAAEAVRSADPEVRGPWARDVELLLAERRERAGGPAPVPLPVRIPASRFHDYVDDPNAVAESLRRPMPQRPYRATRLGTLFHAWVEDRYGLGGDAEELDATTDELDLGDTLEDADLDRLRETFERSPWATRRPVEVEREIHLPFDDRIIVCKIDAVFEGEDGRFEIVDWKTGRAPRDAADLERKQLQLALYRLAFARWRGVDPTDVDAAFYYVADDLVVRPEQVDDEQRLLERWRAALA